MKKIEAVIQPFKLDEIREALAKEKLPRISIFEIKGAGSQQGKVKQYRGARYIEDSADVKIEIVVDDDDAEPLAAMIATILRSGDLCDGEVIITPVDGCCACASGNATIVDRRGNTMSLLRI